MKTDTRKTGRKTLNVLVDGISKFSVVRCVSIGGEMFPFPLLLNRNRNMAAQMRFDFQIRPSAQRSVQTSSEIGLKAVIARLHGILLVSPPCLVNQEMFAGMQTIWLTYLHCLYLFQVVLF